MASQLQNERQEGQKDEAQRQKDELQRQALAEKSIVEHAMKVKVDPKNRLELASTRKWSRSIV